MISQIIALFGLKIFVNNVYEYTLISALVIHYYPRKINFCSHIALISQIVYLGITQMNKK